MARFLTQEWLDQRRALAADQPERPGATARLQFVVTGGPEGDVSYYWILVDGRLTEMRLGTLPDAELTLTMTYADAVAINRGELDANAAFMQGRMKVAGNMAKMMALLPITATSEYRDLEARVREITEL